MCQLGRLESCRGAGAHGWVRHGRQVDFCSPTHLHAALLQENERRLRDAVAGKKPAGMGNGLPKKASAGAQLGSAGLPRGAQLWAFVAAEESARGSRGELRTAAGSASGLHACQLAATATDSSIADCPRCCIPCLQCPPSCHSPASTPCLAVPTKAPTSGRQVVFPAKLSMGDDTRFLQVRLVVVCG